jgi:hypothetical protein
MDSYTAAAISAYGSTPEWSARVARDTLCEEIAARGWPVRKEEYDGYPVVAVRDAGPGWMIVKSRFEAVAAGFVAPDLGNWHGEQ